MTSAGTVTVDVQGRDLNLVALLGRLEARMRETDQLGIRLSQTTGSTLSAAQQRAANTAVSEAQAMARAARAVGDDAAAHRILVQALGSSTGASDRSVASLTASIGRLQSGSTLASEFGSSMKSSLLGIVGPAALASAAIGGVIKVAQSFGESFKFVAGLDATTASIRAQLAGVRDTNVAFQQAAAYADRYKLTQAETNEAIAASIPVIRNSRASLEDILGVFDRLRIKQPGKTFGDAARALSELQAGQVVSIEHMFNVPANDANRMKHEIEGGADAVQVLSTYLTSAGVGMDALKAKTTGAAGAARDLERAQEKVTIAQGRIATSAAGVGTVQALAQGYDQLANILSGDLQPAVEGVGNTLNTALGVNLAYVGGLARATGADFFGLGTAAQNAGARLIIEGQASQLAGQAATEHSARLKDDTDATIERSRAGIILAGIEADTRRESILEAEAAQDSAVASRTAGQAAELQALQTQILAAQAQNAANAFLNLNPGIDQAGIRAAVNAGLIPPLTARLAELTLQIRAAKAELGGMAMGRPETGGDAIARVLNGQAASQRYLAQQTANAAEAQRQQTLAVGTHAQKIKILQAEYERLSKIYGANSEQAINAETKLLQAQEAGAKKGRAAHAAAGAGKLSDQQKLNTSLLADQEKYQDRAEEAERQHGERLVEIEKEYQKRSQEQERANEVSKRQSKADFYENLTSATKDVGPQIAHELSASYETAYAEAQKIAQAGNAKLAADYLALKQKQLQAELEYQKKLAEARKSKDPAEVQRLEAIHKLQTEANAEEEKQLLAGGDANVKARQDALDQEQRNYEEAQGKIGTAAENAAERKVNAALRAGKAVDDENVKLRDQEDIINRIGARAPAGTTAGGGGSAPATTPATGTTAPGAAPAVEDPMTTLRNAIVTALAALQATDKDGVSRIVNAINSIGPRLSGA
jgi:hypothetical protein